jgi:hypothetical protein
MASLIGGCAFAICITYERNGDHWFADAAGIPIEELVAGPKRAGKAKK